LRLEQGRDHNPSEQVIDALARALRLSPSERALARLSETIAAEQPAET
jgi:hypothetical protein